MIKKINIGLSISRNFDKVTIDFLEDPIEYETDQELVANIRKRFNIIRKEINLEFEKIQKK